MKAVLFEKPIKANEMKIVEVPKPKIRPGWVLIKVKGFGLNRAELILRNHEIAADYIQKPVVPGIECVGEIHDGGNSRFNKGDKVVALMGGMGRSFNGSYSEYALVPAHHVFKVETAMDWVELAAIPETFYTAYGSLFESLQLKGDDILLVHGATSALGLAAIQLAKTVGATVIGTSRREERLDLLREVGCDHALVDDENLVAKIKDIYPKGITKILELVGAHTIARTAKLLRIGGIVCVTGKLGGGQTNGLDLIRLLPNGTYLCGFYSNYPTQPVIDDIFRIIEQHNIKPVIGRVFDFEQIGEAHEVMENNLAQGKIVIRMSE